MKLSEFTEIRLGEELISEVYFGGVKIWPRCDPYKITGTEIYSHNSIELTDCYINAELVKSITSKGKATAQPGIELSNIIENVDLTSDSVILLDFADLPELKSFNLYGNSKIQVMRFLNCPKLENINLIDTSECVTMEYAFQDCTSLTTIPSFDTSNVTSMFRMFYNCSSLTTVPLLNTSNVVNMVWMFSDCTSLTTVPSFDTSNVTHTTYMFADCNSLTTIPLLNMGNVKVVLAMLENCTSLTTLGGFKDLGKSFTADTTFRLDHSSLLTRQSCINVFNNLYSLKYQDKQHTIILHSNALSKLSEEDIAIATNKGWVVQ